MEYAIVEAGGSQFKVKKGDVIKVGKFNADSKNRGSDSQRVCYASQGPCAVCVDFGRDCQKRIH